jgi:hypothetical protein
VFSMVEFSALYKFECRMLVVFWMVTFYVLFLNVNALNIRCVLCGSFFGVFFSKCQCPEYY